VSPAYATAEQYQRWYVRTCARCGRTAAKTANFSDGPICRTCLGKAIRTYGTCPRCQTERLLPGRDTTGAPICRDCAGITRNFSCTKCQIEGRLVAGLCDRCRLGDRLTELLDDGTGRIHPPLVPLFEWLRTMARPASRLAWINSPQPHDLLVDLATGRIAVTHEAFTQLPNTPTVTYVSDLLTECGVLPPVDRQLGIYQRWLTPHLAEISEPDHAQLLRYFVSWHQLRTLRNKTRKGPLSSSATARARDELKAAQAFLAWLADHDIHLRRCRQIDLDTWCVDNINLGHQPERAFLLWAMTTKRMPELSIPPRSVPKGSTAPMSQRDWTTSLQHVLTDQVIPLRSRVAGSILLLYAQPVTRILRLTIDDVICDGDQTALRLGQPRTPVPEPLAGLLRTYLRYRPSLAPANNSESCWLFPGRRPGQPLHASTLRQLIQQAGIPVSRGRVMAIRQLVSQMPPQVVAKALGYHQVSATRIAAQAGATWSGYAAGDHTDSHTPRPEPL
jgi:hypothetical protein